MNIDRIKLLIDKYIVDYVYNAARIEGVNTKYLDTKLFVEDGIEPNMDSDKILILKNLKDAYKSLKDMSFLSQPIDIFTLKRVNSIINGRGLVKEAGKIRIDEVYLTNCKYIPPIPDEYEINNSIIDIVNQNKNILDKGIELYLYVMRAQPFIDGNKRTANVFANLYLVQNDASIISIHADKKKMFLSLLSKFYETNDISKIKEFILNNGIYKISN